jgi:uncharacterized protein YlaN (UPF0358 family)
MTGTGERHRIQTYKQNAKTLRSLSRNHSKSIDTIGDVPTFECIGETQMHLLSFATSFTIVLLLSNQIC